MGDLEIEIYMSNFRTFFEKNPKQLVQLIGDIDPELFYEKVRKVVEENSKSEEKQMEPTRKQMIDLILDLNGVPSNLEKVMPFMTHHMGLICLN
jgi:hypothetical protein